MVTFRSRLLAAFLLVVITPLVILAIAIPHEMQKRFTAQYARRVSATADLIRRTLIERNNRTGTQLNAVATGLRDDNEVRRSLMYPAAGRSELLDYSRRALLRTDLAMLQIQNDSGRILSSGHFRNEFDRVDPTLPAALGISRDAAAVVKVRTASGSMLVLARADTIRVGSRLFTVVGGAKVEEEFVAGLNQDHNVAVKLVVGDDSLAAPAGATDNIVVPYIDATGDTARVAEARFAITHSSAELDEAVRDVRLWIMGTIFAAVIAALAVALWMSTWLSRPLAELAGEAARMDLDDPRTRFSSAGRDDELGTLARRLTAMVTRMRASAARLSDAERRATVGEVARQVNHDIKNGLTPIRNVVRHLSQVARENPGELPNLFMNRQQTLESSMEYLDALARNYARLSPRFDVAPCDVRKVIEDVVRGAGARGVNVRSTFSEGVPLVAADAAVLRRILENLVGNAIDALEGKAGEVAVSAAPAGAEREQPMVRITVSDSGRGMTPQQLQRAFDDFYTTKPGGTGLGLSVVRRLVADLSGILRVETAPGRGTSVIVDIPSLAGGVQRPVAASPAGAATR